MKREVTISMRDDQTVKYTGVISSSKIIQMIRYIFDVHFGVDEGPMLIE